MVDDPLNDLNQLVGSQKLTQISDEHRLLEIARKYQGALYSRDTFQKMAKNVSEEFLHAVLCGITNRSNYSISSRVNAVINRAEKNNYSVEKLGVAEYVTEALYDNWWFILEKKQSFRIETRDRINALIQKKSKIEALFPVFYLKPYSPLKNRGPYPDIAEIYSLSRCYEVIKIIDILSPIPSQLTILADGFKYQRACNTSTESILAYQKALNFWNSLLGFDSVVKIIDYEKWIEDNLGTPFMLEREKYYQEKVKSLVSLYGEKPDFKRLQESLKTLKKEDITGFQLNYTFWTIVSFVFYEELVPSDKRSLASLYPYSDTFQNVYNDFIATLNQDLNLLERDKETKELYQSMRKTAWLAAIRYVSISLTDRELNVMNRINNEAIKFTIHAKEKEFKVLTATNKYASITAQHCSGGLNCQGNNARVTFVYRIEREANNEVPLIINGGSGGFTSESFNPIMEMEKLGQPMFYVNEKDSTTMENVYNKLFFGRS